MKMQRVMLQIPATAKAALDAIRKEGYTAAGYLRHLLEMDLEARKDCGWTPQKSWPRKNPWERKARATHASGS